MDFTLSRPALVKNKKVQIYSFLHYDFSDDTVNSILAYPPDHWSLEIMAELGKMNGINQLWLGLDGRSIWSEEESTMAERQWISSSGQSVTEIKWKDPQPIEDVSKQCAFLDTESGQVI